VFHNAEHLSLSLPAGFVSERNKGDVVGDRDADGEEFENSTCLEVAAGWK
jgi:hypothetical protein